MLVEKIKSHNHAYGFVFSAVEFILMALVISPFCFYYAIHGRLVAAGLAGGFTANCLTMAWFALTSIVKREKSIGLSFYFDPEKRAQVTELHPNLDNDTIILAIAVLVPFYLFACVLYDLIAAAKE